MSVIEGIGDEVVQFFSVVLVVVLGVAAWWSTSIREGSHRNVRTVLILERRSRSRAANTAVEPARVQVAANATSDADSATDTGQHVPRDPVLTPSESTETEILTDDSQDKDDGEAATNAACVEGGAEAAEGGERETASGSEECPRRASASERTLGTRIGPFLKAQAATLLSEPATHEGTGDGGREESDQIRVRLKYLNEEQKLVQGRLQEQLGEFKRRNFTVELAADKLVRLIFNGQVLGSDARTLQAYGLYDNCVVHCLVHNQRANSPPHAHTQSASAHSHTTGAPQLPSQPPPPPRPDWNLSAVLYSCLSVVLCLVWYCRYQYAQLFTLTTTAALVGLTGIFTVSIFSLYLPDQDGIPPD